MLEESIALSDIKSEKNNLVSKINCFAKYGILDNKFAKLNFK